MPSKFKYDLVAELVTDGNAKLFKYKSRNSGMTICICQVNGPIVAGYVTFATEAFDDDGLPHTLEHLVFLGSEKYPYKGVLDMLAVRCLSTGTNAHTFTDYTTYTVETAGEEGFLNILPIYFDHLLFPVLTDAAFTTEVHHINGEGEDAGVVYCEMQGIENTSEGLCFLNMLRALYPGHCGYKSETGGLLKNLRESTTNEKVRAYHKAFYRPENVCCIIVGQIDPEKVFQALIPVEERILQEGERDKFIRPWQTPVPPLTESVTKEVKFPTDDEESGLVLFAWRGANANDAITNTALSILLDYLTDTSVAPMNQAFVEIDDPLCNDVSYSLTENSVGCFNLQFSSVPTEKLPELKEKVFALLRDIADGKEQIDMQRMNTVIKKSKLNILSAMEDDPHEHIAMCLIRDFLYGNSVADLENRIREIPRIEKLLEADAQFWVTLLRTYMLDGNHVVIIGTPSSELSQKMAKAEKERIKEQRKRLGPEGLKEKAEILKKAIETNEIPMPREMLTAINIPSVKSIKFHPLKRTSNIREAEGDNLPYSVNKMPCRFQVDSVQSNFVRLFVLIDTSHLSLESRMYLPLFVELLDECAVERNGAIVPYQDVIKQIAEDTVSIGAGLGFSYRRFSCAIYSQALMLWLMVVEEKYEKCVQWVREILYQIRFEPSRIKSGINKMIMNVPEIKQCGNSVVKAMMKNLCFKPESNHWSATVFRQHAFLNKLQKQLEKNPDEVVAKFKEIRESITKPDKMIVHLSLNLDSMKRKLEPERVWLKEFLPSSMSPGFMNSNVKKCSEYIQPITAESTKGLIAGIGAVESSFLSQSAICNIQNIPDYASLLVLINYFIQLEGPMWRQIRGCGYAYSYNIFVSRDTGLIYFSLYRSTHLFKAYKESVNIIESHLNGVSKWDMEFLQSARSTLMYELIEKIKTVADVVSESLRSYCRDIKSDVDKELKELLEKASTVTTTDMERVGMKYLMPLFNPELSRCTVACNPSKVNEICEEFEKLSRKLTVVPSLEKNFMCEY